MSQSEMEGPQQKIEGGNVTVNLAGAAGQQGNGMAVAGFVLALCSVVLFWFPFVSFLLWVLGIVFSAIGLKRANDHGLPNRGLAIAGLVIALVPGTILMLIVLLAVMSVL